MYFNVHFYGSRFVIQQGRGKPVLFDCFQSVVVQFIRGT